MLTTPIYYANAEPHIGTLYTTLAVDYVSRLINRPYTTGLDEHGKKIAQTAEKNSLTPQEHVDLMADKFERIFYRFDCHPYRFIRTTDPDHELAVIDFWNRLKDNGHIYLGTYRGYYSVREESFFSESELIDGKTPQGTDVELIEQPSYFFRLSAFKEKLLEIYNSGFIDTYRKNEIIYIVNNHLEDLSVSRVDVDWGIGVPNDPNHTIYVWIDALVNYLTVCGYPENGWEEKWRDTIHVVGKDIAKFHAIYWPALLMAADIPLPSSIITHGWLLDSKEKKVSKSEGNSNPVDELADIYGTDAIRYALLAEVSFGQDGIVDDNVFDRRYSILSNSYGNLVNRISRVLIKQSFSLTLPSQDAINLIDRFDLCAIDSIGNCRKWNINRSVENLLEIPSLLNAYVGEIRFWENSESFSDILYLLWSVSDYLEPLLPEKTKIVKTWITDSLDKCNFEPTYSLCLLFPRING